MDEWLTGRQAQDALQRSERQVRNYAASGELRTRRVRGRVEYNAEDVEKLVQQIKPQVAHVTEIMPPGPLLDHIRELENRLQQASAEVGYLRGRLDTQQLEITEAHETRKLIAQREAETSVLQQQIGSLQAETQQLRGSNQQWRSIAIAVAVLMLVLLGVVIYFIVR